MTYTIDYPYRKDSPVRIVATSEGWPINSKDISDALEEAKTEQDRALWLSMGIKCFPEDTYFRHQAAVFLLRHGLPQVAYKILVGSLRQDKYTLGILIPLALNQGAVTEANTFVDQLVKIVGAAPTAIDLGLMIQARLAAGRVAEANEFVDQKWNMEGAAPTAIGLGLMIQARLAAGRVAEANEFADQKWNMEGAAPTAIGLGLMIQARLAAGRVTEAEQFVNMLGDDDKIYKPFFLAKLSFLQGEWQQVKQSLLPILQDASSLRVGPILLYLAVTEISGHGLSLNDDPVIGALDSKAPQMLRLAQALLKNILGQYGSSARPADYSMALARCNGGANETGVPKKSQVISQMDGVPGPGRQEFRLGG